MAQTMDVACSTNTLSTGESLPEFNQRVVESIVDGFRQGNGTTVETIKYRVLNDVMKEWQMSFKHIIQLFKTHTPVNEVIRYKILCSFPRNEELDYILSQDFVRNRKLLKILKIMKKKGYETMVYTMLAMDGLRGTKLSQNPNYDMKRYLGNLRINLDGTECMYENEPDESFKQRHILAVRKVYETLYNMDKKGSLNKKVYSVIRKVLLDIKPDLELPEDKNSQIDEEELNTCVQQYKNIISEEQIKKYMLDVHGIYLYPRSAPKSETTNESVTEESESEEEVVPQPPQKKRKTNKTNNR